MTNIFYLTTKKVKGVLIDVGVITPEKNKYLKIFIF